MPRLAGVDIGTSGVRAAVFEADGALVADASAACGYDAPRPGWAEADPNAWWRAACDVLGRVRASGALDGVAAVCVTGQAPTTVLVDDAGAITMPAILWLDTRAEVEAEELGVDAYYLGPKLLWIARHAPDALARAKWVLQSHAFVVMKLCGEVAIDPSTAALARPGFDLATLTFAGAGASLAKMPPLRRAHEVIGAVTRSAAEATGLREGTPVACGGGDFAAATLGAGVVEEGEACLMLGTAGNILVPRRTPGTDARLINAHHVGADRWLSLGGTLSGGAQEWLRRALGMPAFDALDGEAAAIAQGAEPLLFLPYLQGERTPIWDTTARGAFVGLGLGHDRGHLWRALLEGIALSFVDIQAVLEEGGVRLTEIVAANGGGKSALFRQILCDALGVPLAYTPAAGGTVAGAAILAGLACGALSSAADARAWRGATIRHAPSAAATARYRDLLEIRRRLYATLRPTYASLASLSRG